MAPTRAVVRSRDLVLLKLYAGGTQDLWDVRELLQLPGRDRLMADVEAASKSTRTPCAASGSTRSADPRLHAVSRRGVGSDLPVLGSPPGANSAPSTSDFG